MRRKLTILILVVAGIIISGCSKEFILPRTEVKTPASWQFPRKDIQSRAAIKSEFGGQLNLKWEQKNSESPLGPLTIGAGKLIYTGSRNRMFFYDLKTGEYLGMYKTKRNAQTGLVVVDSLAYFAIGPTKDLLICLNLLNRRISWDFDIKDVTGAPIIIDDRIYAGSSTGEIVCLDRHTGEPIWRHTAEGRCLAGPSGDGEMVLFPQDNGTILGLKAATGDIIFEVKLEQPLVTKAVIGDKVYITGAEGGFYALDKSSGTVVWEEIFPYPIWTSPALDERMLYFGDNGGNLRALTGEDGTVLWQYKADGVIVSSPIIVGDYLLFASLDRNLYCLDKNTGTLVSKREFKQGINVPAVSDGKVICVAAHDGTIQCFGD